MIVIKIVFYTFCLIFLIAFLRLIFDKKYREEQIKKNEAKKKSKLQQSSHNNLPHICAYKAHYKNNPNRKAIIWHYLRFLKAYRDFKDESEDFYAYKRNNKDFIQAKGELRKLHPSNDDILIAIRYCQKEYYYGLCDTKIETNDITLLQNWRELEINYEEVFSKTLAQYIEYWDDVINSYMQKPARIKRIHYLISDIEGLKGYEIFAQSDNILKQLNTTQEYYRQMLPSES